MVKDVVPVMLMIDRGMRLRIGWVSLVMMVMREMERKSKGEKQRDK